MPYVIHPIQTNDQERITAAVRDLWGDAKIIVHQETFLTGSLPGLKASDHGDLLGFLHYQVQGEDCEIITLASLRQRQGIGTALIQAVEDIARKQECCRLRVTTTNDNLEALAFYQNQGFVLTGVGLGLVDQTRKVKPSLPEIGKHNIPIHDEIYLEKALG